MIKNLTLAIDEDVLRRARLRALTEGRSVNELVREHLEAYAASDPARDEMEGFLAYAERVARRSKGSKRWTRDEIYDRPVLR